MASQMLRIFLTLITGTSLLACSGGPGTFVERIRIRAADSAYPPPVSANIADERLAARRLVDSGIDFELIKATRGMPTERGVEFGINEFQSSDGVAITRTGRLQASPEEARSALERLKAGSAKVLATAVMNGELGFIAATGPKSAMLAYTGNYYLYTITSPSVRHLIAFQITRKAEFNLASEPDGKEVSSNRSGHLALTNWKQFTKCGLSFFAPPEMEDQNLRGLDSCIARFTGPGMEISWDLGWYGTPAHSKDPEIENFVSEDVTIDGRSAQLATFSWRTDGGDLRYRSQLHAGNVFPERDKERSRKTSLVMTVAVKSEPDLAAARRVLLSVEFTGDKNNGN